MAARWRVPSSERKAGIGGQRKEAGGRGDAVALNDHGAIVQGQAGLKDGKQKVARDAGVEAHAAFDEGAQADIALKHDERPGPMRGEFLHRQHDFVDRCERAVSRRPGRTSACVRGAPGCGGSRTETAR